MGLDIKSFPGNDMKSEVWYAVKKRIEELEKFRDGYILVDDLKDKKYREIVEALNETIECLYKGLDKIEELL